MKRFIISIITFFLMCSILTYSFYKIDMPEELKQFKLIDKQLEIINLGTSHGYSFDYSMCKLYGMNFYIPANTLYYDLQNYLFLKEKSLLADNAIIVLPVSYFVFGLDENRSDRYPDDSFVNQFYNYLPSKYIYSYSIKKEIEMYISNIQINFNALLVNIKTNKSNASSKDSNKKNSPAKKKKIEPDIIEKEKRLIRLAKNRVKHHKKLGEYTKDFRGLKYLERLIEEINLSGHRAILVTTPYYTAYNKNFDDEWLQKCYFTKMSKIVSEFNIPYFDYSHDERFTDNPELFFDSDHLSKTGKQIFNEIFFNDLEKQFGNSLK